MGEANFQRSQTRAQGRSRCTRVLFAQRTREAGAGIAAPFEFAVGVRCNAKRLAALLFVSRTAIAPAEQDDDFFLLIFPAITNRPRPAPGRV